MARHCDMSFADLYRAAHGRDWSADEERGFSALTQEERNEMVRTLAHRAGDVRTEDQVGSDGAIYTAFYREPPQR